MTLTMRLKKIAWLTTGWVFLILGILGFFLPILQGFLFTFIGLIILSSEYVWAHNLLQEARRRFPKVAAIMDQAHEKAHAWFHRIFDRKPKEKSQVPTPTP